LSIYLIGLLGVLPFESLRALSKVEGVVKEVLK
jgi:hypothetical protein